MQRTKYNRNFDKELINIMGRNRKTNFSFKSSSIGMHHTKKDQAVGEDASFEIPGTDNKDENTADVGTDMNVSNIIII